MLLTDIQTAHALAAIRNHLDVLLASDELSAPLAASSRYARETVARLTTCFEAAAAGLDQQRHAYAPLLGSTAQTAPELARAAQKLAAASMQCEDDGTIALIVAAELGRLQSLARAIADETKVDRSTAPEPRQTLTDLQQAALLACICARFPEETDLRIAGVDVISGGFSKQTLVVLLANAKQLPEQLVLRVDKAMNVLGGAITDEYPMIEAMYEASVAVPRPYFLERDPSVLGGPFAALARVSGRNIGDPFTVHEPSLEFARSLAQQMAAIHAVAEERAGAQVRGAGIAVRDRVLADICASEESWRSLTETSVLLEVAYGWLKRNIALADGPRCIIHNDVGCHNLLVQDGVITGVLDWEMAQIGTPAQDLGCAYATVIQNCSWEDFLAEYGHAGGQVPPPGSIDFYRVWRDTWMLWSLTQARAGLAGPLAGDLGLAWASVTATHRLELRLTEQLTAIFEPVASVASAEKRQ